MDEQKKPRVWIYARIPGDYDGTMNSYKVCSMQALHEPLEKGVQVALLAADLPHTADINAVNFSTLNLLHHIVVAGAQQPAAALVNASTDNITAVMQRLH